MTNKKIDHIETPSLIENFDSHIRDEFNSHILVSGPFGAGKSTFLKSYFDSNDDFIVLKLYPVHYCIAQNQDVFELIKYDLIYELLKNFPNEIDLTKEDYSLLLLSQMFLLHEVKLGSVLKLLVKAKAALSGGENIATDTLDDISKIAQEFKQYKSDINKDELKLLDSFVSSFKTKKGHIHESDEITELITRMLGGLISERNNTYPEKKHHSVLLIDDLDRLDPEHVFRLFNIFSAHYDDLTETNKFGFDKIIFVCDINNVKSMFSHRYGISTEFNGYIDKFYSSEVFKFDIKLYLKESLRTLIDGSNSLKYFPDKVIPRIYFESYNLQRNSVFFGTIKFLFDELINQSIIHIRNFQRCKEFIIPNKTFRFNDYYLEYLPYPLLVVFFNAERFFARSLDFETALETLARNYESDYGGPDDFHTNEIDTKGYYLIRYCLPFLIKPTLIFGRNAKSNHEYIDTVANEFNQIILIVYEIHREFDSGYYMVNLKRMIMEESESVDLANLPSIANPNPFWFMLLAYRAIKKRGFM